MARSRHESLLGRPPLPVRSSEQLKVEFRKSESGPAAGESPAEQAHIHATDIFDAAVTAAGLRNPDIAHLCGVSESMVQKWRSRETRACPSFVQMLCLPPVFHVELHKALNRHYGFGRAALLDLLDAAGRLAVTL